MIYSKRGGRVKLLRRAVHDDILKFENRIPDSHDRGRLEIGYLMIGRLVYENGEESDEHLIDIANLIADDGLREINEEAKKAGSDIAQYNTIKIPGRNGSEMQKRISMREDETLAEYFIRVGNCLEWESYSVTYQFHTIDSIFDYFDLVTSYETNIWAGVISAIKNGKDPKPAFDFCEKHKINFVSEIEDAVFSWEND